MNIHTLLICAITLSLATGCASQSKNDKQESVQTPASVATASKLGEEGKIIGTPAPGSKFSKLHLGMTLAEVEKLIGSHDRIHSHQTGKAWIPFYFGKDAYRIGLFYKGEGQLTFSGSLYGNLQGKLIGITVDSLEVGGK